MDDYLFLIAAKLKADRRRLEQQALRATAPQWERAEARNKPRENFRPSRVVHDLNWREQS